VYFKPIQVKFRYPISPHENLYLLCFETLVQSYSSNINRQLSLPRLKPKIFLKCNKIKLDCFEIP